MSPCRPPVDSGRNVKELGNASRLTNTRLLAVYVCMLVQFSGDGDRRNDAGMNEREAVTAPRGVVTGFFLRPSVCDVCDLQYLYYRR